MALGRHGKARLRQQRGERDIAAERDAVDGGAFRPQARPSRRETSRAVPSIMAAVGGGRSRTWSPCLALVRIRAAHRARGSIQRGGTKAGLRANASRPGSIFSFRLPSGCRTTTSGASAASPSRATVEGRQIVPPAIRGTVCSFQASGFGPFKTLHSATAPGGPALKGRSGGADANRTVCEIQKCNLILPVADRLASAPLDLPFRAGSH